ncbi:hypothetical protein KAFR_0L01360 [Kazachstania africana CBS 2517]|uniref:Translation initiation factor eIF2 assembly protein n=1 Tax=Kazachstania africana (strain ATCC 22294 / BCRC 22015 / CBS 2517 / CECT 1963 / NBRC 1671 / NRRL Y-8276) TaxID=1071382 RepID=H2B295_KAZAF|nr:hypothetical protein KAFR_0L01360 [Kazachstania africana CBS 2517]CCF60745.1 hypothetical protein KAFR_0L01360 [Kazachstania africana CBS 2517]
MGEPYVPLTELKVTRQHIENCSFSKWYPNFQKYVPKSRILKPVPPEFIQYLEQDGIKLPHDSISKSFYAGGLERNEENEYSDWESDEESNDEEEETSNNIDPLVNFPEFHRQIESTLNELGMVTPKLNWSAPRDATWILPNNSMKCYEVNEVYLLLNASNYIMHDLQHAFDECDDEYVRKERPEYELILRQWFDVNPALEFRVFVKDKTVVGASQRDLNYYDYLEPLSDTFKDLIDSFVEDVFIEKFPDSNFVLDLYIPRPFNKVFLIDVNPFARKTDPLLFSWNEILTKKFEDSEDKDYELRLVLENNTARFASKEHSENQVPRDVVDATTDPNAIRELIGKWKELLEQQEEDTDSD